MVPRRPCRVRGRSPARDVFSHAHAGILNLPYGWRTAAGALADAHRRLYLAVSWASV